VQSSLSCIVEIKQVSKMQIYILAVVAAAGIGLGGTFGALAVPISGNLVGASAPAPELHKVYYYHRYARRHYRRAYRRGYYGGYYGGYNPGWLSVEFGQLLAFLLT
jgi:hypothetical protein